MPIRVLRAFVFASSFVARLVAQTAFVTGSGYTTPPAIVVAPGQIATFYVGGLPQTTTALPTTVAQLTNGITVELIAVLSAKPVNASTLAITVQIPFDVVPVSSLTIQFAQAASGQTNLCAQNTCTAPVPLTVTATLPHIITTCDLFYAASTGACQLAITHQDGSLVTNAAPAKAGEILTIWALGLGVPASGIPTAGSGPIAMNDITLNTAFEVASPGSLTSVSPSTPYLWAGLPSGSSGLYQINFAVPQPPSGLQTCTQSSEWFTGSGNMFVSLFRLVPAIVTTPFFNVTAGNFAIFGPVANPLSSICVTL